MSDDNQNPYGQDNPYGQSGSENNPYGQQPPAYGQHNPYGQAPQAGGYGGGIPEKHPQATTALVLSIIGILCCSIAAPFAWMMGSKAVKEIDANPGRYSGRDQANIGKIIGIIGTILLVVGLVVGVLVFATSLATMDTSTGTNF